MNQGWAEELPHDLEPLAEPGGSLRGRLQDGREVAATVIAGTPEEADALVARVRRLAELDDARLVPYVGATRDGDAVWVLTELDPGVPLRTLLADGPLPPARAAAVGVDVLEGLAALHAAGTAHGALHPGNVHVAPEGRARLGDYALRDGSAQEDLAAAGVLLCATLGVSVRPADGELSVAERAVPALVAMARALAAGRGGRSAVAALEGLRATAGAPPPPPPPPLPRAEPPPAAPEPPPVPPEPVPRRRAAGLAPLLVLAAALLTGLGVALGAFTAHLTRPTSALRPPVPTSSGPAMPAATATPSPAASAATAAPTPTPAPPAAPAPVPPAPTSTPAVDTPDAAVARFYELVASHQFDAAVGMWSARMRASYPPTENVYQRFADTTSLSLRRDQVSASGDGSATVSIDLVEVRSGQTYHWVGSWYLVEQSGGWFLDQPALRAA